MHEGAIDQNPSYYLEPGYIYFTRTPAVIRTVVGSCVAVCLWDSRLKYGGMNHFLRPVTRDASSATPKFGNVATAALVNMMTDAGCTTKDLVAQIFGGAFPSGTTQDNVGQQNVDVAHAVLTKRGIVVASTDTGGNMGRKVVFDTSTGQLGTLKVHKLRDGDWLTGMNFRRYSTLEKGAIGLYA